MSEWILFCFIFLVQPEKWIEKRNEANPFFSLSLHTIKINEPYALEQAFENFNLKKEKEMKKEYALAEESVGVSVCVYASANDVCLRLSLN